MIEWYIEQTLQELHIQKRYCGYRLLVLSTVLALEDENSLTEVESRIYKPVARQYHCKPSNVERNIRTVAKRNSSRTVFVKWRATTLPGRLLPQNSLK